MTDTSWYPENYYIQPHYSTIPDLRIVDAVRPTLHNARRKFWLKARNAAFAQWAPVGLRFLITNKGPYKANRVTLALADPQTGLDAGHCFEACLPCQPGVTACDWIHITPEAFERAFLSRINTHLKYLIAHEFGHSLGFGHGGDGIMDQTPYHAMVSPEEIDAAKAYWRV